MPANFLAFLLALQWLTELFHNDSVNNEVAECHPVALHLNPQSLREITAGIVPTEVTWLKWCKI